MPVNSAGGAGGSLAGGKNSYLNAQFGHNIQDKMRGATSVV